MATRKPSFVPTPSSDAQSTYSSASSGRLSPSPIRPKSKKLSKNAPQPYNRAVSAQLAPPVAYPIPPPPPQLHRSPTVSQVDAAPILDLPPPPAVFADQYPSPANSRPGSIVCSRPTTPALQIPAQDALRPLTPTNEGNEAKEGKAKRKGFFSSSKSKKDAELAKEPLAWVVGHDQKLEYNLSRLLGAEPVPELWDEAGDTLVYLFPRTSGKGPSFRVDGEVFAASRALAQLAYGHLYSSPASAPPVERRQPSLQLDPGMRTLSLSVPGTPPMLALSADQNQSIPDNESSGSSKGSRALSDTNDSQPSETHLFLPLTLSTDGAIHSPGSSEPRFSTDDIETMVAVRNTFAFLVGQSLVATKKFPSIFDIFMRISSLLKNFEFTNLDGSTFGEVAATSFDHYVGELQLGDVRFSREKTIEGIVLGERMRSVMLYNEAFVHGVGKYDELKEFKSLKFDFISPKTLNRMERASMDLYQRLKNATMRLEDFEFPAIFAGIMNSKTADERKVIRFDAWRQSFMSMRKFVLSHLKQTYGSWPPKASSKKNNLKTDGLNRRVLHEIYSDFAQLYDLLVDRTSITTRTMEMAAEPEDDESEEPVARALRRVLAEYDRSLPPVQPPIPFDVPLLPSLAATSRQLNTGNAKKDAKAREKKLKDEERHAVLKASHNSDSEAQGPFMTAFRDFEFQSARGKNISDICQQRVGQWIFMYAVIQALPMLVVDSPGIRWTEEVEYFLCEPPRSGVPWAREDTQRSWYGIAGSSGVVSLPSDIVEHGVEGIYRRSHCWKMAEKWSAQQGPLFAAAMEESIDPTAPLPLPPFAPSGAMGSAPGSPSLLPRPDSPSSLASGRRSNRESVMALGLEALPLPAGVTPVVERPRSSNDPTRTFDDIIGNMEAGRKKKKDRK